LTAAGAPDRAGLRLSEAQVSELLAREAAVLGRAQTDALQALGIHVVEAERAGPHVVGTDARTFIDCVCGFGVYNLGRRPAEVLEGLREAVRLTDQGNFPLISAEKAELAARLADFAPGDLSCAFFSVARGEALDFACKLARACTGRSGLVTVDGGLYGDTGFALSLSERPAEECFVPLIPGVAKVPFNDLGAADRALHGNTAAMVLEPVQAENGCRVVDPSYLREISRLCRERGALLVLDETQTGMGRTGARFAYDHWGTVPDILVVGESLAAGAFPICATLFRADLQRILNKHPLIHLSTFGGADVGCVVGRRALEVYEREHPWRNAAAVGERLRASLSALVGARSAIKGISGLGLLLAVDLGREEAARAFCKALAAEGVLAMPGMLARSTVVLRPSLLIGGEDVTRIEAACTAAARALAVAKPAGRSSPAKRAATKSLGRKAPERRSRRKPGTGSQGSPAP
jgi:acetylornithine/succinyldiaminopimelate/putrescine aminotransferase